MDAPKSKDKKVLWARITGKALFIPVFLAVYPVAFFFIGSWIDKKLGTEWLKAVFLLLGLFSGGRQVYLLIKGIQEDLGE